MFYREAGQFKTTYAKDMAAFPITQDKYCLLYTSPSPRDRG